MHAKTQARDNTIYIYIYIAAKSYAAYTASSFLFRWSLDQFEPKHLWNNTIKSVKTLQNSHSQTIEQSYNYTVHVPEKGKEYI